MYEIFRGAVYGCRYFLSVLGFEPRTNIVNLSNLFGLVAPPGQAAYAASKFAVRGFTEALRHELEGSRVGVSCVHPGGIRTSIARHARLGERSEEHTSELQSRLHLVCRLLLEKTTADS